MKTAIPSEFAGFVREIGVRAFDRLAAKAKDLDPAIRTFVRGWGRLSEPVKLALFDALIEAAREGDVTEEAPPPKQKKSVRRYDPEEVAATLPKKPAVRKRTKAAGSRKRKKPE